MSTAVHLNAEDTSNYIKHTHANPVQRRLIDRFHKVVLQKIEELTLYTLQQHETITAQHASLSAQQAAIAELQAQIEELKAALHAD